LLSSAVNLLLIFLLLRWRCGDAVKGLSTTAKHLRRTASCAAGNGLETKAKYLRGAAETGLGTTIKYLRCTTRQRFLHQDQLHAIRNERSRGQRPTHHDKYLQRKASGAAGNGLGTTIK
jgi:hypothetical protein